MRQRISELRIPRPVRLRLSRAKGFNLQRLSLEMNGLPAIIVDRGSRWGNPWRKGDEIFDPLHEARDHRGFRKCQDLAEAVEAFRRFVDWDHEVPRYHAIEIGFAEIASEEEFNHLVHVNRISIQRHLAGRNLACWCAEDGCCHADVLLEIANDP